MPIQRVVESVRAQGAAFPQIGDIRKGAPKGKDPKTGKETLGKNLEYFRVQFADGEQDTAQRFYEAFGHEPTVIKIFLPFNETERCWQFWQEAYARRGGSAGGTLVHRCDGEWVNFARDPRTMEVQVMNWLDADQQRVKCPCSEGRPVYTYPNKKGEDVAVFCREVGRLRVIVPALERLAYLMVHTTSFYDLLNITENLEAIREVHGSLVGVPLLLQRKKKEVNTPYGRRMESLIFIEADPEWVQAKAAQMRLTATPELHRLPAPRARLVELPALTPADIDDGAQMDDEAGEDTRGDDAHGDDTRGADAHGNDTQGNGQAGSTPATQPGGNDQGQSTAPLTGNGQGEPGQSGQSGNDQGKTNGSRPYQAEALKAQLATRADSHASKSASVHQRGLVAGMLKMCFAGYDDADERRRKVQKYLWGVESFKDASDAQVLAALDWLKPVQDSGGAYLPSEMAVKEAKMALHAAALDLGQMELPIG